MSAAQNLPLVQVPVRLKAAVSQSLESAGLGRVDADDRDRRSKVVALTFDGHRKVADVLPGYFEILSDHAARDISS